MTTLADRERAGYVIDEWARWQQGECWAYAVALIQVHPSLRFGTFGAEVEMHHFAHDDTHAYDSAGAHPLPYLGIDPVAEWCELDGRPEDYDASEAGEVEAAVEHIRRHPASTQRVDNAARRR